MFSFEVEDHVSDDVLLAQIMREQEVDAAIAASPSRLRTGRDHSPDDLPGMDYQKCGGGRRIVRKKIGSN